MLGVAAALNEASGYAAWPWEQERDEQTAAAARAALGEEHYARAVADGRKQHLEQAIDEAIRIAADMAGDGVHEELRHLDQGSSRAA